MMMMMGEKPRRDASAIIAESRAVLEEFNGLLQQLDGQLAELEREIRVQWEEVERGRKGRR